MNGQGPDISKQKVEELFAKMDKLKEGDVLVLAGSIPSSMPSTMYSDMMERLQGHNVMTVVDATNDLLLRVLQYHPFLIKPNNHKWVRFLESL